MGRSTLSIFFALLLVALTASPFTAPFQTFDLSTPASEAGVHDGVCADNASKDCALLSYVDNGRPLVHAEALMVSVSETIAPRSQPLPVVLRL